MELSMGTYIERVEPQVRDAVKILREKGYSTYESGFERWDTQSIGFEKSDLENVQLPGKLTDEVASMGAEIEISADNIRLTFYSLVSLDTIEKAWDKVVAALPDLGKPVEDCQLQFAEEFRESQAKINA